MKCYFFLSSWSIFITDEKEYNFGHTCWPQHLAKEAWSVGSKTSLNFGSCYKTDANFGGRGLSIFILNGSRRFIFTVSTYLKNVAAKNPLRNRLSETLPSCLIQSTQWLFSLPGTWQIICFYPTNFLLSRSLSTLHKTSVFRCSYLFTRSKNIKHLLTLTN